MAVRSFMTLIPALLKQMDPICGHLCPLVPSRLKISRTSSKMVKPTSIFTRPIIPVVKFLAPCAHKLDQKYSPSPPIHQHGLLITQIGMLRLVFSRRLLMAPPRQRLHPWAHSATADGLTNNSPFQKALFTVKFSHRATLPILTTRPTREASCSMPGGNNQSLVLTNCGNVLLSRSHKFLSLQKLARSMTKPMLSQIITT